MPRTLLVYPKSPHTFWTFHETTRLVGKGALNPPLGLLTVASLLPKDWDLKLVDRAFETIDESLWSWAEVVMISAMMAQRSDAMAVLDEATNRGKRVVVGGPYPSLVPEDFVARGAHWVVRGEGEASVPLLVSAIQGEGQPGVIEEPYKPDLTLSPVPRFDLLRKDAYDTMTIQSSRGCPYNCDFCDIGALYGVRYRQKSPPQFLKELEALYALGWRSTVFVADDNFIGNRGQSRALLRELIPWMKLRGNPFGFWTQASVDLGDDMGLVDLMTEANFSHVFLGIETPDEDSLVRSRKAHNARLPMLQRVRNINANGLSIVGSFILGFDGEEQGAGERVRTFVEEAAIPMVLINALQAVPRTPLWYRLGEEGRLREEVPGDLLTGGPMNFIPTRPEAEIREEIVETTLRLYEPGSYLRRARRFYLRMRPTRRAMGLDSQPSAQQVQATVKDTPRRSPKDRRLFLSLLWKHGVVAPHRWQFWNHVGAVMRGNPSRMVAFLIAVGLGGNVFRLRDIVKERMGARAFEPGQRNHLT